MSGRRSFVEMPIATSDCTNLGELILKHVPPDASPILDIGCGNANLVKAYAYAGHPLAIGLDLPSAFEVRRQRRSADGEFLVAGDGCALPFVGEVFGAIFLVNGLHHISADRHALVLGECYRTLRHGGVLFVLEMQPSGPAFELTHMLSDETPALLAARASLSPLCTSTWKDVERTDAVVVWQVADILSLRAHYRYEFDHLKFIDQNSSAVENRMRALIARRKGRWGLDCHVSVWRLEK